MLTTKTRKCRPWWKFGEIWGMCSEVLSLWKGVGINLFWLLGQEIPTSMDLFKWIHNLITTSYLGMDSEIVTITTTISNRSCFWTYWSLLHSSSFSSLLSSVSVYVCSVIQSCLTLLQPHGLYPARLLCPWDLPGKNTGAHCHFLLLGIFPTQESNLISCIDRQILYHWGSPSDYVSRSPMTDLFWWDLANTRL